MSQANPLWGAPRIHGELLKFGIEAAQSTVAKYLPRPRKPRYQTWRTFLTNHLNQMASRIFSGGKFNANTTGTAMLEVLQYRRSPLMAQNREHYEKIRFR